MVEIGEKTGRLATILGQTAEILEAESERRLNRALTLLVPALTFAIGALVAGLIGSVMMVVTSMNDLVQ
jgi:general secretion pathway protein F